MPPTPPPASRSHRRGSVERAQGRIGLAFVAPYALFLLAFGLLPTLYAIYLAFTKKGAFVGFANFLKVFKDYRFLPAVEHVGIFLVVWLVALVLLVVVLAIMVHSIGMRWLSGTMRFVYYIPGALAGASSVMLWLFVLDPTVSPVAFLLEAMGFDSLVSVVQADRLPFVLAIIAFWTGAGGWIVVMYGALNNIPREVLEAARVDGAGPIRTAWSIQIPLMRKWIAYMVVLSFRRRHAALRRAARPRPGEPRRRLAGLLAQPARLPLCLQAIRFQRLGRHLAGAARRSARPLDRLRVQGRPV
jgi:multiple sugar transport system permease protein